MEINGTQRLKILIIEDDIVDRKLLQRLLSQSALSISDIKSAECLKTALGFLDKECFDVVFLDLGLPDSQGIESFSAIHAKIPDVPVIVLSGLDDEETAVMAVKKGVQDYLVKGQIDSNLLTRAVRYAIERKKAAEQLRQTEEKYRMQFEGALDAIFVADAETGILIDCNPAATRLVGREKSELIGQHQRILHPPEMVEGEFSSTFKQHLKEKQGQTLETLIVTKTGEIKDVAIMASLLEVGGKKVLQGIFRDITDSKRAEAVIKQEKEFAESMFNTAPVIMLVLDTNTRIVNFNPCMEKISGYKVEEVKNKDWFGTFLPERDHPRAKELFKRAISGEHTRGNINPIVTKDGHEVLVEWYDEILRDKNGQTIGLIAIGQDITERKKAEQERQLAEEKYRTIFENSAAAITLVDEREQIISWNKFTEDLLGMDKEDLYLRPVKSLYSEGQWEKIRTLNIVQKGVQRHLETKMIRKDGRLIDVDVSLSVLKNSEGKIMGSIGVTTDITERKRAEEELKEAMETKSQFVSTVSHELRTPLASMKEAISIVLEEVSGKINKDQKNFLNIAQKNIDRLAKLINEVLDFQKLSANKMKFNMRENDIREVVKDACHTMTLYAEKKKVKLSVKLDDDLPKARFDSDGIMQVLTNLISNSIKFTPENGQVFVSVQHKGEDLVIQVSDTGIGVPKENLPKLFAPFYQVHQHGQQVKGTGLGLAIVSKIVMMHGGRIEVESEVGQGTTFTVFLPLDGKPTPEILPEKMDNLLEKTVVDSQAHAK
ncbi:MAG: PAS domain S-box protein [Sedimentisphaerales bacterium]